jgi:hypothetical protein
VSQRGNPHCPATRTFSQNHGCHPKRDGSRLSFHQSLSSIKVSLQFWGEALSPKAASIRYVVEPFLPSILSHNAAPTAYPPTREHVYFPLALYGVWEDAKYDNDVYDAIRQSAARIRDVAIEDGQDITNAPLYPNYALFDTPLSDMYGGNVDKLRALRQKVDPHDVMGLAGGFRF